MRHLRYARPRNCPCETLVAYLVSNSAPGSTDRAGRAVADPAVPADLSPACRVVPVQLRVETSGARDRMICTPMVQDRVEPAAQIFGAELPQTGRTLGYSESGHQPPEVAVPGRRCRSAGQVRGCWSPTEPPQLRDTVVDPHRNPTDETAHSGTLVMRVKGTENSRSAASMRVSWAVGAFSR